MYHYFFLHFLTAPHFLILPFGTQGRSRRLKTFFLQTRNAGHGKAFMLWKALQWPAQFQSPIFFDSPQSWGEQVLDKNKLSRGTQFQGDSFSSTGWLFSWKGWFLWHGKLSLLRCDFSKRGFDFGLAIIWAHSYLSSKLSSEQYVPMVNSVIVDFVYLFLVQKSWPHLVKNMRKEFLFQIKSKLSNSLSLSPLSLSPYNCYM